MTGLFSRFSVCAVLALTLLLAGCTGTTNAVSSRAPVATQSAPTMTAAIETKPTPSQTTATALATTDLVASIEPAAVNLLSDKERADASQAAFYALQFGRPGAPRTWSGSKGSGQVTVGPYVRVNNLDCRDFTHTVTVSGAKYARKGTACREVNGNWSVVQSSSAA